MIAHAIAIDYTRPFLFISIIITISITLIIFYLLLEHRKAKKPVKGLKLLIIILISGIIIQAFYYTVYEPNYPSSQYTGLYIEKESKFISADELNLSASDISSINNDTFHFIIEVENSSGINRLTYNFIRSEERNGSFRGIYSPVEDGICLKENFSFQYNFCFYWEINSSELGVQNIKLLGDENKITGHFITNGQDFNITIDEKYNDLVVINDESYDTIIELPFKINIIMWNQWVC
ncbi:MAG: hypothetical protein KAS67_03885 [Thermoplasmata archaeon]|nr:hypothetical protein [Thermoplasmata archaeon]